MIKIIYFSCSGNGKKIANTIKDSFVNIKVELVDITSLKARTTTLEIEEDNFVVIVFPIYAGDVPIVLKKYFKRLNGKNAKTTLISLYGNIHTGKALFNAKQILKKRGFNIVSGAEIVTSHSYNNQRVKLGVGKPDNKDIIMINSFINKSMTKVAEINFSKEKRTIMERFFSLIPQNFIRRKSCDILYNNMFCKNCEACKAKCPVGAINEIYKVNNKKCIRCLACTNCCPNKAISFSFSSPKFEDFLINKGIREEKDSKFYL